MKDKIFSGKGGWTKESIPQFDTKFYEQQNIEKHSNFFEFQTI